MLEKIERSSRRMRRRGRSFDGRERLVAGSLMHCRHEPFLPQLFDFVLENQFLSLQFDQFQIVGRRMRLLGVDRLFDRLMTTLEFRKMRL